MFEAGDEEARYTGTFTTKAWTKIVCMLEPVSLKKRSEQWAETRIINVPSTA